MYAVSFVFAWLVIVLVGVTSKASAGLALTEENAKGILPAGCLEFTPGSSIWRYRYCHLDHVEQFLALGQVVPLGLKLTGGIAAHTLGKWTSNVATAINRVGDSLVFTYLGGDTCLPQSAARMTMARLSCSGTCGSKNSVAHISSVSEPTVCVYVIDICAPALCSTITTNKRLETQQPSTSADKVVSRYSMSEKEKQGILDKIRTIFYHSYDAYLKHAFPFDELRPLSCVGTNTDLTPGGMLTLIDALDTLATLGNVTEFQRVVRLLSHSEGHIFAVNSKVSVFETTIRVLGGLLSAHLLCVDSQLQFNFPEYNGALLRMAKDLGDRLLPAFQTSTTLPYGTVNLLRGVPFGETTEACTAAAGSLSLEFGMLSILTGDPKYGKAARSALKTIFDLRSSINLIGRHLDVNSGQWTEQVAGIGSNIDSVYEYYLKQYILFGDDESLEWFEILYEGAIRHLRLPEAGGRFYHEVDMRTGQVVRRYFSALQAFWPGMQVLAGDIQAASKSLNGFLSVWEFTSFLPEDFDLVRWTTVRGGSHSSYLLRPELAESVFYAYRATKDDSWLIAGKDMIDSVSANCFVPKCGYAAIQDVDTKQQMDFMPSFFLSEWVKYLVLLFDDKNFLNQGNWVFTTEAHPFRVTNWTQKNDFTTPPYFRTKADRKKKFSRTDFLPDIPSLEEDEDICRDLKSFPPESYYRLGGAGGKAGVSPQSLRPFDKDAPPDVSGAEKKVVGYLPDVGTFEIVSTTSSFSVSKTDANQRVIISNLDASTAMIWTNDAKPTLFVGLRRYEEFVYAMNCKVEILVEDLCPAWSWFDLSKDLVRVHRGPCSVGDGFGSPLWFNYQTKQAFEMIRFAEAPNLCDAEMMKMSNRNATHGRPFFIAHALRGDCSFEEKAQNALSLGAIALLVTLKEPKDEPFIMAHAWNGSKDTFRPATPAFLTKSQFLSKWTALERRLTARPRVRVVLSFDKRATAEKGRVVVTAFPGWQAVFGPQDDHGVFRLNLLKKV